MSYIGGKARAKWLYPFLNHEHFNNLDYIEPFVGKANVLMNIKNKRSYTASDNEPMIINLLQNIQANNLSYPFIEKEEYLKLKSNPSLDYNKACFAAYTYVYLGEKFTAYFDGRWIPRTNYYSKLHNNPVFQSAKISVADYRIYEGVENAIIYCDPPYAGTSVRYGEYFENEKFWEWVKELSKKNFVFVTEYNAPSFMMPIFQKRQTISFMRNKGSHRIEKLFVCNKELVEIFPIAIT